MSSQQKLDCHLLLTFQNLHSQQALQFIHKFMYFFICQGSGDLFPKSLGKVDYFFIHFIQKKKFKERSLRLAMLNFLKCEYFLGFMRTFHLIKFRMKALSQKFIWFRFVEILIKALKSFYIFGRFYTRDK